MKEVPTDCARYEIRWLEHKWLYLFYDTEYGLVYNVLCKE